jgi:putative heme iron utilization protein
MAKPAPQPDDEAQTSRSDARTLVERERHGILCTAHAAEEGWPFGSIVPHAVLPSGDPVIWISDIAEHTRNLRAEPRACLFVHDTERIDDVQAAPRVALLVRASVPSGAAAQVASKAYFGRFPEAKAMESAHGFSLYVLHVEKVRWIAGFGSMGWLSRDDWAPPAPPDPLAPHAAAICDHMNADHAGALLELARHAGTDGPAARLTAVDAAGLTIEVAPAGRGKPRAVTVPFPRACTTPEAVRKTVIAMLAAARKPR